jgi:polysaccharide export outer membrane protein
LVYYQNIDETSPQESLNEVKLQPDDLLLIIVSAEDPEIAAPLI